jgi:hypothetical protein
MTRTESKSKTFDILHFVADNAGLSTFEAIEKAYNMGVSEQEHILDKIRAEIKSKIVKRPWLDFEDRERDRNDAFLEVLDIIDKYKAESEEEE